jgi:hypothetical protein
LPGLCIGSSQDAEHPLGAHELQHWQRRAGRIIPTHGPSYHRRIYPLFPQSCTGKPLPVIEEGKEEARRQEGIAFLKRAIPSASFKYVTHALCQLV